MHVIYADDQRPAQCEFLSKIGEGIDRAEPQAPVAADGDRAREAGIGKTRLLAEALSRARGRSCEVPLGRAEELEQTRSFGVIAEALGCDRSSPDPRRAAIAALLTAHAQGGSAFASAAPRRSG